MPHFSLLPAPIRQCSAPPLDGAGLPRLRGGCEGDGPHWHLSARHSWEQRFGGSSHRPLAPNPSPRSKQLPRPRLHTKPGGRESSAPLVLFAPPVPAGSPPLRLRLVGAPPFSASCLTPDPSTPVGAAEEVGATSGWGRTQLFCVGSIPLLCSPSSLSATFSACK